MAATLNCEMEQRMTAIRAHLVLMGLRASGKSIVGHRLASVLGVEFTDLDDLTAEALGEEQAGVALAKHGEPRFRDIEADVLGRLLHESPRVIALGGGTPTGPRAYQMLVDARAAELVNTVYLHASAASLRRRLEADPTPRPSLTGLGTIAEVDQLYARRDPLYRELADRVIDAEATIESIVAQLRE
jgi:shikimate kinase